MALWTTLFGPNKLIEATLRAQEQQIYQLTTAIDQPNCPLAECIASLWNFYVPKVFDFIKWLIYFDYSCVVSYRRLQDYPWFLEYLREKLRQVQEVLNSAVWKLYGIDILVYHLGLFLFLLSLGILSFLYPDAVNKFYQNILTYFKAAGHVVGRLVSGIRHANILKNFERLLVQYKNMIVDFVRGKKESQSLAIQNSIALETALETVATGTVNIEAEERLAEAAENEDPPAQENIVKPEDVPINEPNTSTEVLNNPTDELESDWKEAKGTKRRKKAPIIQEAAKRFDEKEKSSDRKQQGPSPWTG